MASPARSRWILAAVLLASIGITWWVRRRPPEYPTAYVGDRAATLWSTTAQVRQAVTTLGYGERVAVVRRSGDQAEVRTEDGSHGWMDGRQLMDTAMWERVAALVARAQTMPVQAAGHTRALSNVHAEPGRDARRIFTFGRDVPVLVLERRVLGAPAAPGSVPGDDAGAGVAEKSRQEDWLFVLRGTAAKGGAAQGQHAAPGGDLPIAGWVLSRLILLDPPQPIPDYATSSGIRVVAWAALDTVPDAEGDKPQYLLAGTRGGEGQACDFTLLRVYTWGASRRRYETAYVENGLCGRLPIQVQPTSAGPEFRFTELDEAGAQRVYRLKQTVVRRVKEDGAAPKSAAGKKR